MKTNFIKTMDSHTANILKKLGLQLVSESNNEFIFLNIRYELIHTKSRERSEKNASNDIML